ncbi:hypothetical protein ACPA9J_11970 [Pseudomonas aeruginosa]
MARDAHHKPRHRSPPMPGGQPAHAPVRHHTRACLAEVAVSARQWANLNPETFARGPLSVDDVLARADGQRPAECRRRPLVLVRRRRWRLRGSAR